MGPWTVDVGNVGCVVDEDCEDGEDEGDEDEDEDLHGGDLSVQVLHGRGEGRDLQDEWRDEVHCEQGCQMAKFDPFLSLDCAGIQS